jgi:hypothetical protein
MWHAKNTQIIKKRQDGHGGDSSLVLNANEKAVAI